MNRTLLNIIIDLIAALLFVGMIATGYLLRYPLPPGSNKSRILWGLGRHQWGDVHFWISLALLATMLCHIVLHWNWIVTVIGKRCGTVKSSQASLMRSGISTLMVVGAMSFGFAWLAESQVRTLSEPGCVALDSGGRKQEPSREVVVAESGAQSADTVVWNDVYPIFARHCVACHGPESQLAGVRLDRHQDFLTASATSPLIVPRHSGDSRLMAVVTGSKPTMAMADRHRLDQADLALIQRWIDQGAN